MRATGRDHGLGTRIEEREDREHRRAWQLDGVRRREDEGMQIKEIGGAVNKERGEEREDRGERRAWDRVRRREDEGMR